MSMMQRTRATEGREAVWADTFKAMGDRTRLSILLKLMEAEHCVTDLGKALKMDAPKVSFHLTRLKFAGLVVDERQGQRVIYRLNPELAKVTPKTVEFDIECCLLKFPRPA